MDRMLATAELLRGPYRFRGYVHLKIIPGSSLDQVERAMALATRLSVNMEAPPADYPQQAMRQPDTRAHAPDRSCRGGRPIRAIWSDHAAGGGRSGRERSADRGRGGMDVPRAQAGARLLLLAAAGSGGTALADQPPVPFMREHRLYQVDFLLRSYGFALDEIDFDDRGALLDPKSAWARRHPEHFPVEINTAPISELLRVPGLGPRSARRIAGVRCKEWLRSVEALGALGVSWRIAAPFVLLDGKPAIRQMSLF